MMGLPGRQEREGLGVRLMAVLKRWRQALSTAVAVHAGFRRAPIRLKSR